ncbi:MAG TPA: hypothetical protein DC042_09980 [Bacteroidales bacterium]|nr:hypothetical protein [Bacteroidales bacterium]
MGITISLIYNLSLLVAISIISAFINDRWQVRTLTGAGLQGLIFGTAAVIGILAPFTLSPGLIFDGRSVVLSLSSLVFGPVTGIIAGLMAIIARLTVGGPGTTMGILVIMESVLVGLFFFYRWRRDHIRLTIWRLLFVSLAVHLLMLALILTLPKEVMAETFRRIVFPVLVIYPLAAVLIGKILIDQEARKRALEEADQARKQAEQANQMKDAFISNVSHEIRTPLNAILGFTNLLQTEDPGKYSPEENGFFNRINQAGNRLMRSVDLIINFSRLQIGDFVVNKKEIDLRELIESQIREIEALSVKRHAPIVFTNQTDYPLITSDYFCISQSVAQILNNAVKFSNGKKVDIRLFQIPGGSLSIEIRDNGIGIAGEHVNNLFSPYSTEEKGLTRSYGGLGLGLSLAKKLLDQVDGVTEVKSVKGEGTVFTITFPPESAWILLKKERPQKPKGKSRQTEPDISPGAGYD